MEAASCRSVEVGITVGKVFTPPVSQLSWEQFCSFRAVFDQLNLGRDYGEWILMSAATSFYDLYFLERLFSSSHARVEGRYLQKTPEELSKCVHSYSYTYIYMFTQASLECSLWVKYCISQYFGTLSSFVT